MLVLGVEVTDAFRPEAGKRPPPPPGGWKLGSDPPVLKGAGAGAANEGVLDAGVVVLEEADALRPTGGKLNVGVKVGWVLVAEAVEGRGKGDGVDVAAGT